MNDARAVTVRRQIPAPADALFDAWLDAESLGTWLKPSGTSQTRAETDPRVGGSFRIVMVQGDDAIVHTGTYREIERPHRLVFTWTSPATHLQDTLVTVTFQESSGSTLVEVHQVGLPDAEAQTSHHGGWSDALDGLVGAFQYRN